MRNFTVKLAGMYRMHEGNYTNNPEHPDIIRCTLEDALNIATHSEYADVHPSAPKDAVTYKAVMEGSDVFCEWWHRGMVTDWAQVRAAQGNDVYIEVDGYYYNRSGFSKTREYWKPEGVKRHETDH